MHFKLIYISPNGTTKITSEILKKAIEKDGHSLELVDLGQEANRGNFQIILKTINKGDIVGFGSPAYHMDMLKPMKEFFETMKSAREVYSFKAFLYLNYGGITSGKAFTNSAKLLENMKIPIIGAMKVVAPHFHHSGQFPTESSETFIQRFYNDMRANEFTPILGKRQDELFFPQKKRVNLLYPLVHFIAKKRELPIIINPDKCKTCGKCEKECPVGAINLKDSATIDLEKCIHCYHCTVACKLNAVEAPIEKLDKMIKLNKRIIGRENPQNEIYI